MSTPEDQTLRRHHLTEEQRQVALAARNYVPKSPIFDNIDSSMILWAICCLVVLVVVL